MSPARDNPPQTRFTGREVFGHTHQPVGVERHTLTADLSAHDHDFMEIVLVTAGRATHQTIHGKQAIGPGDLLVIRPWFWHAYLGCDNLKVWNCYLTPDLLGQTPAWAIGGAGGDDAPGAFWLGGLHRHGRGMPHARLNTADRRRMLRRLTALHDAPPGSLELAGRLYLLLDAVARAVQDDVDREAEDAGPHPAVARAINRMESDLAHPWTLDELAAEARLDPAYLVRLFNKHIHDSPIRLLLRLRCERAAGLLIRTDRPIAEVGHAVGWDDPAYFARRFRAYFGLSPSAYRDTMR